jgi:iron complex outermembrane receptor protein
MRVLFRIFCILALLAVALNASYARGAPATQPVNVPTTLPDDSVDGLEPAPAAASPAAPGDDLAPELDLYKDIPVVVAAAKHEQTVSQAPASVSVVTADDIELFGYENLADVLRDQRSFYLETDGLNWFAGVRGFSRSGEWNSRISVLVDDRPTNEIVYGQAHLDTDFVVPMEMIKQVEIIRGPGSALYGTNAVFGVVNVVTKTGADVNGVVGSVTGGTLQTGQANILAGGTVGGWDLIGDFNGYSSQGDQHIHYDDVDEPQYNYGNINHADYEGAYQGYFKAQNGDFSGEIDFANREKGDRDATYQTSFFDPGTMLEQSADATVKFDHEFNNQQSLHAMAYYSHYGYQQGLPTVTTSTGLPSFGYTTTGYDDYLGQEVHYDDQITRQFRLTVGANGTESLYARQRDYTDLPGSAAHVLNIPTSYNAYAGFLEGELDLTKRLTTTIGVRVDEVQRLNTNVSPRLGIVYQASDDDVLKALYGRAFRDPNLYELEYYDPGANIPNPDLKPEVIDTVEGVWERRYLDGWSTSIDDYFWELHDTMEDFTRGDGAIQTRNTGTSTAEGIEGEVDRRWDKRASFRLFGTYTWANENGQLPDESPKWIVGSALALPIISANSFIAVEPQLIGPEKSPSGRFTDTTYITNVVFKTEDLVKTWTFQLGAYNLFAHQAHLPGGGAQEQIQPLLNYPSTEVRLTVSHRF